MADNHLQEQAIWEPGIRQLETTDVVKGGDKGVPNIAPRQLANRTLFLKEKLFDKGQFLPYNNKRTYRAGEICYTETNGELSYWQWYSNVESLAGKSPSLVANRHVGWSDNTKPFYWVPYTGDQVGMPFYWIDTTPPEWAVMEINVDLPVAVYWRLARRYPHLVTGNTINTGEIRGEFLRVLDQGRGVDSGRSSNTAQVQMIQYHNHGISINLALAAQAQSGGSGRYLEGNSGGTTTQSTGGNETRPRNVARAMAIAI